MIRTFAFPIAASLMLAAAAGLTGCACACPSGGSATSAAGAPTLPARISHVVFVKLNDPADAGEAIRDCNELLAPIPGVVAFSCGKHLDTGRPTVDSDYDVGLFIGFDTTDAYSVYVDHPNHVAILEKWRPRSQWLRVSDFLDER